MVVKKTTRRRVILIMVATVILVVTSLGFYTWRNHSSAAPVYDAEGSWRSLDLPHRLRNGPEHDSARKRNGGNPYVLYVADAGNGSLLYYGASHTQDPSDPQIADIAKRWNDFRPSVALCEGRAGGYFFGALIEPFAGLPEPALVHKLARRDDVPIYSLEPGYADEVEQLLTEYTAEQVGLYFFLRVYSSESGGNYDKDHADDLVTNRTDVEGLRGHLNSTDDIDRIWRRDFAESGD